MAGKLSRTGARSIRRVLAVGSVVVPLAAALAITGAGSAGAAPGGNTKPGKLARLVLSPAAVMIAPGAAQPYTAQGFDAAGISLGDVTSQTTFTISPNGSCTANRCSATTLGPHTVTGTIKKISGSASLTVIVADLAASETVSNAAPFFYAPVTFTTTVTNTSTTTTATGVSATVNVPAALVSPTATPGTGSYETTSGTWTIGSLTPGASATLTITGNAGDVNAGTQTVTATVTAATFDPNLANNTASASEASQPAPVAAVLTAPNLVDVCAAPPDAVTSTWSGTAVNAINPAAPPPIRDNYIDSWFCDSAGGCPTPLNDISNSPFITYANNTFVIGQTYRLVFTIFPGPADPNYADAFPTPAETAFNTVCLQ